MPPGLNVAGRGRAVRALVALTAVSACFGAVVTYASTRDGSSPGRLSNGAAVPTPRSSPGQAGDEALPPRPSFIETPEEISVLSPTQFRFHVPPRSKRSQPSLPAPPAAADPRSPRRFQCRLDGGSWEACASPRRLGTVPAGPHTIAVRAFTRAGRAGPAAAYSWRQVKPKPIAIETTGPVEDLYPGLPAQALQVVVRNPNDVPVEVTSLTVELPAAPSSCPAENFELAPSSASPAAPLAVPAGGSVGLPMGAVSAPTIRMLNPPVNQDACQGAQLRLVFNAEARG
jgi:hypothetical protein